METANEVWGWMVKCYDVNGYMPYEKAIEFKDRLHQAYLREYEPLYTRQRHDELICRMFRESKTLTIKKVEPDDRREVSRRWVWECFTQATQHIYGKTMEHCLDQVIAIMERQKKGNK